MRRIKEIFRVGGLAIVATVTIAAGLPGAASADTTNAPSLVISQFKVTSSDGQFITLYNATDGALDMSKYQLEYFNNYDLGKATSSKLIGLSGTLPPHGYFMVDDGLMMLCYRLTVDALSMGFASTAGLVQVNQLSQSGAGGSVGKSLQDYVAWSKTAAAGAQTLPSNTGAFLQRQPVAADGSPAIASPGVGSWQTVLPNASNPCAAIGGGLGAGGPTQLLLPTEPPATFISGDVATGSGVLPPADIGLMAPRITELLPNPDGTGNDATDEFIELYNPNGSLFDLTGFSLQTGTTSLKTYSFPAGTVLQPTSFKAFYASVTGLSLSNTSSQVKLLDPFGNSIGSSDAYSNAKDGQAWALGDGKWYWTTKPTPNAANIIAQPVSKKPTAAQATAAKAKAVKAKLTKSKVAKLKKPLASQFEDDPITLPIHARALVLVGSGALLYGAYEYRADLANRIFQLRSYLASRRGGRP